MGHVMVERRWLGGNIFGDHYLWITGKSRKNRRDLVVREMLEHLSHQVQIRCGQLVRDDVGTHKADARTTELLAMVLDKFWHYVHAGIFRFGGVDDSPPNREVATTAIDNASDLVLSDIGSHCGTVQIRRRSM